MISSNQTKQTNLILCPYFWVGLGLYTVDQDYSFAMIDFVE